MQIRPIPIWFTLWLLFLTTGRLMAQVPFTCQDQFFLTFTRPPTSLNEVVINNQNNVEFKTIRSNLGVEVNAIGYRSSDNFIYAIATASNELVRIDASGNVQVIAQPNLSPLVSYFAGDISPDGRYLVLVGTRSTINGTNVAAELARIDLESPTYATTRVVMNTTALIFDIAFNPVSGLLYGYDSNGMRLVRIDENTGAITSPFQQNFAPGITGSLFFDAFGNLFAYGSGGFSPEQNRLYQIDTQTGVSRLLTSGQNAEASDGCSCPYTVQLNKTANRHTVYPCSEVEYTFTIANTSGRTQTGLRLEDVLPAGFTFARVKSNPLSGTVLSEVGDHFFILDNLQVPTGRHEVVIVVQVGDVPPKIYKNQARLSSLPASLGGFRLSDDPTTIIKSDSTAIEVQKLNLSRRTVDTTLCLGSDFVQLDARRYITNQGTGAQYFWQDGSRQPTYAVRAAGEYRVGVLLGCDTAWIDFRVRSSGIQVKLEQIYFEKRLGDSLFLEAIATLTNAQSVNYQWLKTPTGTVRCETCPQTWAYAFNDEVFIVRAENEYGCWDTAQAVVKVAKNYNVYFPNIIQPDGSREFHNDGFTGFGDPATQIEHLAIYSRWGELIFETRNIPPNNTQIGWRGTHRDKPVLPGVYVWVARLRFLDGYTAFYSGDVGVVR